MDSSEDKLKNVRMRYYGHSYAEATSQEKPNRVWYHQRKNPTMKRLEKRGLRRIVSVGFLGRIEAINQVSEFRKLTQVYKNSYNWI